MAKKVKKLSATEISIIKSDYNPATENGGLNALSAKYKISKKQLKEILGIEVVQKVGLEVSPNEDVRENLKGKSKERLKVGLKEKSKKLSQKAGREAVLGESFKNDNNVTQKEASPEVGLEVGLGRSEVEVKKEVVKEGLEVGLETNKLEEVTEEVALTKVEEEGLGVGLSVASTKETQIVNDNMNFLAQFINLFDGNIDTLKDSLGLAKNTEKLSKQLEVHLPLDTENNFKASIRVNKVVWDMFKEFCDENKQFKQKELLSQALLNMINTYK